MPPGTSFSESFLIISNRVSKMRLWAKEMNRCNIRMRNSDIRWKLSKRIARFWKRAYKSWTSEWSKTWRRPSTLTSYLISTSKWVLHSKWPKFRMHSCSSNNTHHRTTILAVTSVEAQEYAEIDDKLMYFHLFIVVIYRLKYLLFIIKYWYERFLTIKLF